MLKTKINPFDFYLLRMPALSIDSLFALNKTVDSDSLVKAIFDIYQSADLQDSIFLASPELYQELLKWLENPQVKNERLMLTLYKYVLRMSSRCTPYGLFAGFSMGKVSDENTAWKLKNKTIKHSRLDMNYVAEIASALARQPELKVKLTFYANNSLYKTDNTYRYYEYKLRNKKRDYFLISIKSSRYVDSILNSVTGGAKYDEILNALVALPLTMEVALDFLDQVIDSQLIVSELEPTVTGHEFFDVILDKLESLDKDNPKLPGLLKINTILRKKENLIQSCKDIEEIILEDFPYAKSKDLVQTDLEIGMSENTLNKQSVNILANELSELSGLIKTSGPADLKTFREKFSARYEDKEIPLLEALDTEAGIGYSNFSGANTNYTPLVDGLILPAKKTAGKVGWTAFKQLVFKKFHDSQQTQSDKMTITAEELQVLGDAENNLPPTFYSVGSFVAANNAAIDQGDFKFNLSACGGSSAIPLLGRFASSVDALKLKLEECAIVEQEAYGEAILAEVIHLPEARIGNILQRPRIRPYEIPFLGNSSADADHQIPVTDLMVSVKHDKIVLRSKRLNRVIIPRLSSAHNYSNGISVYKFLCDLQGQGNSFSVLWDWDVLSQQSFLPRIEYKHIILSRARWRLESSVYQEIKDLKSVEETEAFRSKYKLPSRLVLAEGDNELLLDFDCPLVMPILVQHLKKKDAILYEFLHDQDSLLIAGKQQTNYLNELVIPFQTKAQQLFKKPVFSEDKSLISHSFPLGSEWTYVKIYCGSKWADTILTEYLLPVVTALEEEGLLRKWFFIRYYDPEGHIRMRFLHEKNAAVTADIINRIQEALELLSHQRIVCKIQYDTYEREIERYGERTMELSETIFYNDSTAVINFLNLIEGEEGERYRWLFAMRGVEQLLGDFNLPAEQRQKMMESLFSSFFDEFNGNKQLNSQLNDKYRAITNELNLFMNPENDEEEIAEAVQLFDLRSVLNQNALGDFKQSLAAGSSEDELNLIYRQLLPSYIHMFLNRIFIANQRLHELVVYHHLAKYYASLIARRKHSPVNSLVS
ncbi:lantibiotic dehydratase [Pedobacter cryoconitis]|uniref:Thiopeptide-type bacteriocin biosynthesis protein n=1 Tax=Pedobacter cryoconitis TaxID=188932 RepID=A0A7X0MHU5_9SPHI|nr:lantibiotic dehydratase [Pedobacter cryoconitis]MBB6499231.1 thiopeptide-type bacteriocin biosynthesis protein [Pedobacter cryoconitis]